MPEYPGWNLDLRWTDQEDGPKDRKAVYPMGIHHGCYGAKSEMVSVRELAMMMVMDCLTDKPDWHVKVFDEEIAEKWRQEALAWPDQDLWYRFANELRGRRQPEMPKNILDRESVDYCILELRDKAEHFRRTSITPTLDASFSIAKSDVLVPHELQVALREAFARLQADQSSPDWHPGTGDTVQDLVHPSMYPLVYGRSRFLPEEAVGVEDAVDKWAGKGNVIPRKPEWNEEPAGARSRYSVNTGRSIDPSYWSTTYQWLPANIKFTANGGVEFTSYVNNLHPTKYRDIYKSIEKLIEISLPMWDQCVVHSEMVEGAGRHWPRLRPDSPSDENWDNWDPNSPDEMRAREKAAKLAEKMAEEPETSSGKDSGTEKSQKESESESGSDSDSESESESEYYSESETESEVEKRWSEIREPVQPSPPPFSDSRVNYTVDPTQTLYERFKNTPGLQVFVKMASVELTPENPTFSPGDWHIEGQMNEHIVGTLLYYLDSDNVTDSHLDFRALTRYDEEGYWSVGQDAYYWMQSIYGATLGSTSGSPCLQKYGRVNTPPGRLLAFPNVFQHCVSGFELVDKSRSGYRRFIALWLVDPHSRIISTANVPPQQAEWWAESAFGALNATGGSTVPPEITQLLLERGLCTEAMARGKSGAVKLNPEILNMVRRELGDWPMTRQEAEDHRLALMEERSAFQDTARENWESVGYSFCEH
ncbi:hypothetical protein VTI74DRAFT_8414 [Chaetomium olivicolor]